MKHLLDASDIDQRPIDYVLPLLDVLAAALELDLAPNPTDALRPIRERLSASKETAGTLSAALALHAWEEESPWLEVPREVWTSPSVIMPPIGREMVPAIEREPKPRHEAPRREDEEHASRSGREQIPQSIPAIPLELWQERFHSRLRQSGREDIQSISLRPDVPWEAVRELLQKNERNERLGRIHLQGNVLVEFSRQPIGSDGTSELRLAGASPEVMRRVVDGLVDLFQSHRKRARTRKGREQRATMRERIVTSCQIDTFPAEQDGDEELTTLIDDAGFARILFTRSRI